MKHAADFSTPGDACILVLDASGAIRWKIHGPVTGAAFDQLEAAITAGYSTSHLP
jgi:hypothetical protein